MKPDGIFGKDKSEVSYDSPPPIVKKAQSPLWPEHALIGSHHVADALVDEFLQAFALPGFGRIDVALGVGCDAVDTVELARLTTAVAECGHLLERLTHNHANPIVLAVRHG